MQKCDNKIKPLLTIAEAKCGVTKHGIWCKGLPNSSGRPKMALSYIETELLALNDFDHEMIHSSKFLFSFE